MAMTLVDMAKGMKDELMQGVMLQFAQQSLLYQMLPFDDVNAWNVTQWQAESVSNAGFRRIGSPPAEQVDVFDKKNESVYIMSGKIDIDVALLEPVSREFNSYVENVAVQADRFRYGFSDAFINGDRTVDPDKFNGLKRRIADLNAGGFTDVLVPADSASSGLELGSTSAKRHQFLDKFEDAEFEVADGMVDIILTSKKGYHALGRVGRREGLLDTTRDMFGRKVIDFRGIPILWAGTLGNQTTEIITSTEDPGDGGNDATSYYFCRLGSNHVRGIQLAPIKKIYDQVTSDAITHRIAFDWYVGLRSNKRSAVRLSKVVPNF